MVRWRDAGVGGRLLDSVWIVTFFCLDNHRPSVCPAMKGSWSVGREDEGVMSAVNQAGGSQIPDRQTKKWPLTPQPPTPASAHVHSPLPCPVHTSILTHFNPFVYLLNLDGWLYSMTHNYLICSFVAVFIVVACGHYCAWLLKILALFIFIINVSIAFKNLVQFRDRSLKNECRGKSKRLGVYLESMWKWSAPTTKRWIMWLVGHNFTSCFKFQNVVV